VIDREGAAGRAQQVFPAGSNGEFDLPPELAIVVAGGDGCRLTAADGSSFVDFSMGWGSALVGHGRPEIAQAVAAQAARGANFAHVNEASLALAEEIVRLAPAVEQIRFCASGTEATMYCQRLARAFTGRPLILKFEGAYHGANEIGVTSLFPHKLLPFPTPDPSSDGIAGAVEGQVLVAPFNDLATTEAIADAHAERLAAIIVEPLQRCTPPVPGFLKGLRALADRTGALLLFDEVVTGFRLAYGGAQEFYGVLPDLVAYGKALGGGLPIGAFGGRADIMAVVREDRLGRDRYVWVASTLGGNPISSGAALAALEIYRRKETYPHLHEIGRYLRDGMRRVLASRQLRAQIIGDGPLAQVVFSPDPVFDYRSTRRGDREKGRALMLGLFRRGIFLNPMGTKLYLSLAHDRGACDQLLDRLDDALGEIA
jgi:glutamate-1-semialdehyde 2,1-aminomutase